MLCRTSCNASLDTVRRTRLRRPEHVGSDWKGVKFGDLLDEFFRAAKLRNMKPVNFQAHLSRDGADLTCSFCLAGLNWSISSLSPYLGIDVSNARRRALTFYMGGVYHPTKQFGNASFVVDSFTAGTRFGQTFDLVEEVSSAIDHWSLRVMRKLDHSMTTVYDKSSLSTHDKVNLDRLLITLGRDKVIPWSKVGKLHSSWNRELKSGPVRGYQPSNWIFLQHFNRHLFTGSAVNHLHNLLRFNQILDRIIRRPYSDSIATA